MLVVCILILSRMGSFNSKDRQGDQQSRQDRQDSKDRRLAEKNRRNQDLLKPFHCNECNQGRIGYLFQDKKTCLDCYRSKIFKSKMFENPYLLIQLYKETQAKVNWYIMLPDLTSIVMSYVFDKRLFDDLKSGAYSETCNFSYSNEFGWGRTVVPSSRSLSTQAWAQERAQEHEKDCEDILLRAYAQLRENRPNSQDVISVLESQSKKSRIAWVDINVFDKEKSSVQSLNREDLHEGPEGSEGPEGPEGPEGLQKSIVLSSVKLQLPSAPPLEESQPLAPPLDPPPPFALLPNSISSPPPYEEQVVIF